MDKFARDIHQRVLYKLSYLAKMAEKNSSEEEEESLEDALQGIRDAIDAHSDKQEGNVPPDIYPKWREFKDKGNQVVNTFAPNYDLDLSKIKAHFPYSTRKFSPTDDGEVQLINGTYNNAMSLPIGGMLSMGYNPKFEDTPGANNTSNEAVGTLHEMGHLSKNNPYKGTSQQFQNETWNNWNALKNLTFGQPKELLSPSTWKRLSDSEMSYFPDLKGPASKVMDEVPKYNNLVNTVGKEKAQKEVALSVEDNVKKLLKDFNPFPESSTP